MKRSIALFMILGLAACAGPSANTAREAGPVLPFIQDDYPTALQQARAEHKPIFIEIWAPW